MTVLRVASPSQLVAVGIGIETMYGTAAAPAVAVPITSIATTDNAALVADQSWRSSVAASNSHQLGTLDGTIQMQGLVHPDTIGFPLSSILGDLQMAGAAPPYTWKMAALNSGSQQPHSHTITTTDPSGTVSWAGAVWSSVTISGTGPDALLTWSGTAATQPGTPTAYTLPTSSAVPALPGWAAAVTIGGTVEATCETFQVEMQRKVTPKRNSTGMVTPYLQRAETLTITGSATVVARGDAYRQQLLNATATSIDIAISQGGGASTRGIEIHSSLAYLTTAHRVYGSKWIELEIAWTCDGNATDVGLSGGLSPVMVTLTNAKPSGSY